MKRPKIVTVNPASTGRLMCDCSRQEPRNKFSARKWRQNIFMKVVPSAELMRNPLSVHFSKKKKWIKKRSRTFVQSCKTIVLVKRLPWSSGYGRRVMFRRPWVRIPAQYSIWTFFHIYLLYKIVMMFAGKDRKYMIKRGRGWPIFYKRLSPLSTTSSYTYSE